jgi:nitroreductase
MEVSDDGRRAIDLTLLELLVTTRRTSLRVDPDRAVPIELIERLARLATWAPNHKKTWPWRFAVFTGEGRSTLGHTIADALERAGLQDAARLEKYRTKYRRAPAMLVMASAPGDTGQRSDENRDAVAAGVQNLLLGATAAGLASFWSSAAPDADEDLARLCGWESGTRVVAIIYLGWPIDDVARPERPAPEITRVDT